MSLIYDDIVPYAKGLAAVYLGGKFDTSAGQTAGGKWGVYDVVIGGLMIETIRDQPMMK